MFAADPELPMQGDTPWTAEAALEQGIAETGLVKSWSDHTVRSPLSYVIFLQTTAPISVYNQAGLVCR